MGIEDFDRLTQSAKMSHTLLLFHSHKELLKLCDPGPQIIYFFLDPRSLLLWCQFGFGSILLKKI